MKVRTAPASTALDAMAVLADDVTVRCDAEGWHMMAWSRDRVSVLAADVLPASVTDPEDVSFTIPATQLSSALKRAGAEAEVTVGDGRLTVIGEVTTRLAQLAPAEEARKMPQLDMDASAVIPVDRLRAVAAGAPKGVDQVWISVGGGAEVAVTDDAGLGASVTLSQEEAMSDGEAKGAYPLSHLMELVKVLPRGSSVSISLSTDRPMELTMAQEGWSARAMVAPRIVSEE